MCNVSLKASVFLCFFAPAGTMRLNGTFTQLLCQFLNLHVDGQCLKNSTLVKQKF